MNIEDLPDDEIFVITVGNQLLGMGIDATVSCAERGERGVIDGDGNRLFSVPQWWEAKEVAFVFRIYDRAFRLGEQTGRAILQGELRKLLDISPRTELRA